MISAFRESVLRRSLAAAALAAAALLGLAQPAHAAVIDGPIKLIVTFPPGGGGDIVGRLIALKMSKSMGQPVVVENRPGASGRIASEFVKRAPADGTTLLLGNTATMVTGPLVLKNMTYDPVADFVPVSHTFEYELSFAVAPNAPVKDLSEYAKWAAADPKNAVFGSPAGGGLAHFLGLQIGRALKLDLSHIGFKGSAPLVNDLMGSQIPAAIDALDAHVRLRSTGKLKVLATSGKKRSPYLPDIPTFTELGYPEVQGAGWFGIFAPARTPKAVVDLLSKEIAKAVQDPEVQEKARTMSYVPTGTTSDEFARIFEADRAKWGPIIKASGFVSDQ